MIALTVMSNLYTNNTIHVLHFIYYITQCFEGMKAYYCVDGKVKMFRPMENMRRLSRSAEAASLPVRPRYLNIGCN